MDVVGGVRGFATGVHAPVMGLSWIRKHRCLWLPALAPFMLAIPAYVAGLWFGITVVDWSLTQLFDLAGWWETLARWGGYVLMVPVALVVVRFAVLPIVAGPFYDVLSARTQALVRGESASGVDGRGAWWSIVHSVRTAGYALGLGVLALLFGLIPVVGPVVAVVLAAKLEALAALDVTFAHHGMALAEKRAWLSAHRSTVLGAGLLMAWVGLVPFVGAVLTPGAVVGLCVVFVRGSVSSVVGR